MCRGKSIRNVRLALASILLLSVFAGCNQEMANQPRVDALEESAAFQEGLWNRQPVPGTVARGVLRLDDAFFTGKVDGQLVAELPERALANRTIDQLLARGQSRFNAFCSHCHGQVGGGSGGNEVMREAVGMVVKRGFPMPPTYHQERLRRAPIGHFFDVITNGIGRMAAHGYLVPPEDRWAIAAYIRTLQFSQFAPQDALPAADVSKLAAAPIRTQGERVERSPVQSESKSPTPSQTPSSVLGDEK